MIQKNIRRQFVRRYIFPFYRQAINFASDSVATSTDEKQLDDEKQLRDISRMRPWHKSILHGQPPPIDTFEWQKERWALKERYAIYGRASGVDPGVHWPTSDELKEIEEKDDELETKLLPTIEEMHLRRAERKHEDERRYVELEKKAKEYPKVLEAYRKRLREEQEAIDEEKRLKEEKIKEIQSYFGFAIEVTDPRFTAMIAKKELEERQARKKQMKKEKEMEALRKLEEETKLLKHREQIQFQTKTTEAVERKEEQDSAKEGQSDKKTAT